MGFRSSVESIDRHRVFNSVDDQDGSFRILGWLGGVLYGENAGRSSG